MRKRGIAASLAAVLLSLTLCGCWQDKCNLNMAINPNNNINLSINHNLNSAIESNIK